MADSLQIDHLILGIIMADVQRIGGSQLTEALRRLVQKVEAQNCESVRQAEYKEGYRKGKEVGLKEACEQMAEAHPLFHSTASQTDIEPCAVLAPHPVSPTIPPLVPIPSPSTTSAPVVQQCGGASVPSSFLVPISTTIASHMRPLSTLFVLTNSSTHVRLLSALLRTFAALWKLTTSPTPLIKVAAPTLVLHAPFASANFYFPHSYSTNQLLTSFPSLETESLLSPPNVVREVVWVFQWFQVL
ncbi:hypothetical protein DFH07DRAFT_775422 [Mycena maculata]|uniref:Uncharacterized protein n=1 Tax=Mycena maculata TaxID=230809 RepID=A0AAD7N832_9AGAR|nr:hypothetical protein DFH07DRAFT_775422 [Mycena maculata]